MGSYPIQLLPSVFPSVSSSFFFSVAFVFQQAVFWLRLFERHLSSCEMPYPKACLCFVSVSICLCLCSVLLLGACVCVLCLRLEVVFVLVIRVCDLAFFYLLLLVVSVYRFFNCCVTLFMFRSNVFYKLLQFIAFTCCLSLTLVM